MEFIYQKLVSTDEKVLRGELKKIDINGFEFLIYLIKKFT
jgi:predicted RNA-binding protein